MKARGQLVFSCPLLPHHDVIELKKEFCHIMVGRCRAAQDNLASCLHGLGYEVRMIVRTIMLILCLMCICCAHPVCLCPSHLRTSMLTPVHARPACWNVTSTPQVAAGGHLGAGEQQPETLPAPEAADAALSGREDVAGTRRAAAAASKQATAKMRKPPFPAAADFSAEEQPAAGARQAAAAASKQVTAKRRKPPFPAAAEFSAEEQRAAGARQAAAASKRATAKRRNLFWQSSALRSSPLLGPGRLLRLPASRQWLRGASHLSTQRWGAAPRQD